MSKLLDNMTQEQQEELEKALKKLKHQKKPVQVFQPPPTPVEKPLHPHANKTGIAERLREFNPIEEAGFFQRLKNRWKANRNPEKAVLINMELLNGMHTQFIVLENDGGFTYKIGGTKKKYLFDNESKYWIINASMYCYDFHEGFALPIKRSIPINNIKGEFSDDEPDVEYAINPETLRQFSVAKIAEGIMRGADISKWMTVIMVLTIIIMVILIAFFITYMIKSGMFHATALPTPTTLAGMIRPQ